MKTGFDHLREKMAYDEYLRRLDVRAVLDHYGIENDHEEQGKDGTTEIIHSCLIDRVERHHANGDANPSAACNIDKKLYLCYAFWGGNMFDFIAKMEDKEDFNAIVPILGQFLGEATLDNDSFLAELDRIFSASPRGMGTTVLPAYSDRMLTPWAWVHPYLSERGIDKETASRLHIGWREDLNRITIPVFWKGHLVGWQARAIPDCPGQYPGTWGGGFPKYKSSPGFPKSAVLYAPPERAGYMGRGGQVVVVESPFSVIKATALGIQVPVVATFGAKVSSRQLELLRGFDKVTVWADADDAGRIMERKIVTGLDNHTRVFVVTPDQGIDMADYDSADLIQEKIDAAVPAVVKTMEWGING